MCVVVCVCACMCTRLFVCIGTCMYTCVRYSIHELPSNSDVFVVNQLRDDGFLYTYDGCVGVTCEKSCMNGTCAVSLMLPGVRMHVSHQVFLSIVSFPSLYV